MSAIGQRGPSASFFDLEVSPIRPPSIGKGSEFYQDDFTALVSVGGLMRGYPSGEETKDIYTVSEENRTTASATQREILDWINDHAKKEKLSELLVSLK